MALPSDLLSELEHVCHLRDIEQDGYHVRIHRMLEESNPSLLSLDGTATISSTWLGFSGCQGRSLPTFGRES